MRRVATLRQILRTVALVLLVSACGDGDSDREITAASASTVPVTTPLTTPPAPAAPPEAVRIATLGTDRTVVVEGMLPTPCHEIAWVAGTVDADGVVPITLTVSAPAERLCAQVLTPYRVEIDVAELPAGAVAVRIAGTVVPIAPGTTAGRP